MVRRAPTTLRPDSGAPQASVRLHVPRPYEVLVQVAGTVDALNGGVLVARISATFAAAVHVVLDLSGIAALTPAGVEALAELDRTAARCGTQLHIVGGARAQAARHAIEQQRRSADDGAPPVGAVDGADPAPR